MNRGFWDKLNKPIMALAPMADVTDVSFRTIIAKYGKPPVMYTEFVSADGLLSPGRKKLAVALQYTDIERPIVAQIFGAKPENFYKVAQMLAEMKFDGIDINMGCPEKSIQKQNACAALIGQPTLAKEIIAATIEGARFRQGSGGQGGGLPVSVKTRIGLGKVMIEEWVPALLDSELAAIIFHLRTRKEMSKVPAHWELMPRIMEIVNSDENIKKETVIPAKAGIQRSGSPIKSGMTQRPNILGNGDVMSLAEAQQKVAETGCDGVMLGRAIFGNPWLFAGHEPTLEEKLRVMIEHTYLYEKQFTGIKPFDLMKKHYKAYVHGFDGAKEIRTELMEQAKTAADVERIILKHFPKLTRGSS